MYLAVPTLRKSHGHFIKVSFSIKPGDQTGETESPNLVNKTVLKGEYTKAFLSIRYSEIFQVKRVTN